MSTPPLSGECLPARACWPSPPHAIARNASVRVRSLAYEHWIQPVEFSRTIQKMYADGVRIFVEVGPRGNLTAFVEDILAGQEFAAIPANVSRRSGIAQLNHLLAQLAAQGAAFTTAPFYRRRSLQAIDLTASSHAGPSTRRL